MKEYFIISKIFLLTCVPCCATNCNFKDYPEFRSHPHRLYYTRRLKPRKVFCGISNYAKYNQEYQRMKFSNNRLILYFRINTCVTIKCWIKSYYLRILLLYPHIFYNLYTSLEDKKGKLYSFKSIPLCGSFPFPNLKIISSSKHCILVNISPLSALFPLEFVHYIRLGCCFAAEMQVLFTNFH